MTSPKSDVSPAYLMLWNLAVQSWVSRQNSRGLSMQPWGGPCPHCDGFWCLATHLSTNLFSLYYMKQIHETCLTLMIALFFCLLLGFTRYLRKKRQAFDFHWKQHYYTADSSAFVKKLYIKLMSIQPAGFTNYVKVHYWCQVEQVEYVQDLFELEAAPQADWFSCSLNASSCW